jgi:hypothetical protein
MPANGNAAKRASAGWRVAKPPAGYARAESACTGLARLCWHCRSGDAVAPLPGQKRQKPRIAV